LTFDTTPTSGSTNPVTSGGVYTAINSVSPDFSCTLIPNIVWTNGTPKSSYCTIDFNTTKRNQTYHYFSKLGSTLSINGNVYDSSKTISAFFKEYTPITSDSEFISGNATYYLSDEIRNDANIIAKGTGSFRIYISRVYRLNTNGSNGVVSQNTDYPYVQYDIEDGELANISTNIAGNYYDSSVLNTDYTYGIEKL
jgi:hypothetical protein